MGLLKVLNHRESRVVLSRETRVGADKKELKIEEMVLQGGANNVDEGELAKFRENKIVDGFFSGGMLAVEGAVVPATEDELPKYGGDLAKLKPKAALRAIETCTDARQLRAWINQDGRNEIREALIKRHAELMKGAEAAAAAE